MATNNRDVKMTLSVETLGAEDIKKLQTSVLSLAKEAGDAAPEFEKLAAEIGQLGSQADALRSFETLAAKVTEAAQAQDLAAAKAAELKTKYDQLQGSTDEARARQEAVTKEWLKASSGLDKLAADLRTLKQTTDAAAKSEDDYKQSVRENQEAQAAAVTRVRELNEARKAANKELSEAEANERRAARASEQSADAAERNQRALAAQQTELKKLGDELDALGLSSQNVVASQVQLKQALDATGRAAQEAAELGRQSAAIDKEAAEAKDRLAAAARAQAAAAEESARRRVAAEADVDRAQDEILQRTLAVENRKNEIRQRTADLQRQRANQQTTDDLALLNRQYAAEEAASDRIIAMKKAAYDRIAALARENAQKTEAAARQSAQALADAFGSIGIRNVQDVNAEIEQVRRSMQLVAQQSGLTGSALAEAMGRGNARVNELQREVRELSGQLTLADRAANLFKNSMGQIAAGNLIADAIGALVERVKEMGREFIAVNIQTETVRRALTALYKDSGLAARQFEFLQKAANQSGISMSGITDSFVRFSAATKASNIPLEQTNALFAAVTRAGATLGLSSERVQLALDALGQIASKGVVSMEELRQQLGDSLPGALTLTAKGLGITDAELIKLVESGRLASRDFFPAFTRGLQELQGETTGLAASWNQFKNAFTSSAQAIGDAGAINVLNAALRALATAVGVVAVALNGIVEVFSIVARGAGILLGSIATLTNPLTELNNLLLQSGERLSKIKQFWLEAGEGAEPYAAATEQATEATTNYSTAIESVLTNTAGAATATTDLGKSVEAVNFDAASAAAKILGDNTLSLEQKFVQFGVAIESVEARQVADIEVKGKLARAAEEEGQTIERLAKIRGDEVSALQASVEANAIALQATEREAESRNQLVRIRELELAGVKQLVAGNAEETKARVEKIKQIEQRLAKAQAEAEVSSQELKSLQAVRLELQQQTATYADNSSRVSEFMLKLRDANSELASASRQYAEGRIGLERLNTAKEAVARATGLLRDALSDELRLMESSNRLLKSQNDLRIAEIRAKLEEARAAEQLARAKGDESAAERAVIAQKQIATQLSRASAESKISEAKANIALIEQQMAEERQLGTLTQEKRNEYEARLLNEKAKLVEAQASTASIKAIEAEIAALKGLKVAREGVPSVRPSGVGGGSGGSGGGGGGGGGGSRPRDGSRTIDGFQYGEELNDPNYRDASGRTFDQATNIRGQGPAMDFSHYFAIADRLSRGEDFREDEIPFLESALRNSQINASLGGPGSVTLEGRADNEKWVNVFRQALERAKAGQAAPGSGRGSGYGFLGNGMGNTGGQNTNRGGGGQTPPPPQTAGGRTININFGGRTTAINVASAQDEAALIALLQQLEGAAGRAGG